MVDAASTGLALAVLPVKKSDIPASQVLAQKLGIPGLPSTTDPSCYENADALLILEGDTLSLQQTGRKAPGPVSVDFGAAAMRHRRRSGHNELLGRAVGVGKKDFLQVLDATAGLGRDSFVLADLGCTVTLCERQPVIAELLSWGLRQAVTSEDAWLADVAKRMSLLYRDTLATGLEEVTAVDVIYLDPMFPSRDKSAAVKKDMALFQLLLEGAPDDGHELLAWALAAGVARVVVKRPAKADSLGGHAPSYSIQGKAVRYDVYVQRALA